MPSFSVITQQPVTRQLVQERLLERAFHDSLFPQILFRGEAKPQSWPGQVGDSFVFSSQGLLAPAAAPKPPGVDPTPKTAQAEQWEMTLQQWTDGIDTHTPTAMNAIANFFRRNCHQLGLQAAQSMNRAVRNALYNAALAGQTLVDGGSQTGTTLRVLRLNGFTRARRPDLALGSPVRFSQVSSDNPLKIKINGVDNTVVGFTPDNTGDEFGPGTLTLGTTQSAASDRDTVVAVDSSYVVRAGGASSIDGIISTNILTFALIRLAIAQMRADSVPRCADGRFHLHTHPFQQAQLFGDSEFRQVNTALPDYYMFRQFAIGEFMGMVLYDNAEAPSQSTVGAPGTLTTDFTVDDPFAGPLLNTNDLPINRALLIGMDSVEEYWQDQGIYVTEAGINGKIAQPQITNNSIEVFVDHIQLILAAPIDRLQDWVRATWRFVGAFPTRTDATTGSARRFKREIAIETA
jgi:hypothetical protein